MEFYRENTENCLDYLTKILIYICMVTFYKLYSAGGIIFIIFFIYLINIIFVIISNSHSTFLCVGYVHS